VNKGKLKYRAKPLLEHLGIRLRPGSNARSSLRASMEQLRSRGVAPATVIDVGVADGTYELYETFPGASHLLVEPMAEFEPALKLIAAEYGAQYIIAAADEEVGECVLEVSSDLHGVSLLKGDGGSIAATRTVPKVRLDDVVTERNLSGPYLLKVDVQGAELRVLSGAETIMRDCVAVVLETSLHRFYPEMPLIHEVIRFMNERGFVPYDIFGGYNRPLDGAMAQVDITFVPESSPLRSDDRFQLPGDSGLGVLGRAVEPLRRRIGV
jgi:FkbM family methyltransferase